MTSVRVVDAAAVTAMGDTCDALWDGLLAGRTAIRPVRRFAVERYGAGIAACIEDLTSGPGCSLLHALLERLWARFGPVPGDTVLLTATTKGGIDNLERAARGAPAEPGDVLLSGMIEAVAGRFDLTGGINVSAACASSTIALGRGAALIRAGRAESVLVVCADLVTEFVFSGFSALQALSPEPCRPFDRERHGLSLGEGAAALLLMREDRARREGRAEWGTILGWGIANDAQHITAPARDACGLIRAARRALEMAGVTDRIAAYGAHGTGTVYNDCMELTALRALFGVRRLPIYGVKGAIGHTLGAAGGIEAVIGLLCLRAGVIPPTVGFRNPEPGAEGLVSAAPAALAGDAILLGNAGFGGINAALVLGCGGYG